MNSYHRLQYQIVVLVRGCMLKQIYYCKCWYNLCKGPPYLNDINVVFVLVNFRESQLHCIEMDWIADKRNIHSFSLCHSLSAITDDNLNFTSIKYQEKCLNVIATSPRISSFRFHRRKKKEERNLWDEWNKDALFHRGKGNSFVWKIYTHIQREREKESYQFKWDIDFRLGKEAKFSHGISIEIIL